MSLDLFRSSIISLWSENTFYMISVLLNLFVCWMWSVLVICSMGIGRECIFCPCLECFINVDLIFYEVVLAIVEREKERERLKSPNYNFYIYLILSVLLVLASHILQLCCLVHTHLGLLCVLGECTLSSLYNVLLCLW